MKEYKVNVPEMIKKEDAEIASYLINGEWITISDNHPKFNDIPKDWLEEIETESKVQTPEEWVDSTGKVFHPPLYAFIKDTFRAGERNNEFRHKPKMTFDKWFKKHACDIDCCGDIDCSICEKIQRRSWVACDENRGFNNE